jgi:hypothetical protein
MLQQAMGKIDTTLALLESDSLDSFSLSDASPDRSHTVFNLDAFTELEAFNPDLSNTDGLNPDSVKAETLNLVDAPDTGNLFGLSTNAVQTTSNATTLTATYDDPIEWGDPVTDQYYWRQQSGQASCAVVAQISAYQSLTGNYISEQAACNYAQAQGWFNPQTGTPTEDTGNILDALGISIIQEYNATLNDIAIALSNGDKPLVALDANEIWTPKRDRYGNPVQQNDAGHVVWVTGIDQKANGLYNVILNDSGTPYGRSEVVSYADFDNAWTDRNHYLAVADNPFT